MTGGVTNGGHTTLGLHVRLLVSPRKGVLSGVTIALIESLHGSLLGSLVGQPLDLPSILSLLTHVTFPCLGYFSTISPNVSDLNFIFQGP